GPSIDCRICWSGCSQGMLDPAASTGVVKTLVMTKVAAAGMLKWTRTNGRIMSRLPRMSRRGRHEDIIAGRSQTFDAGKLDKATFATAASKHRDDVDGLSDERAWYGDHGLLHELLEAPQGTECGAGMDRADTARMPGAPCFEQIERFGPSDLTNGDAVRPQPQRRTH